MTRSSWADAPTRRIVLGLMLAELILAAWCPVASGGPAPPGAYILGEAPERPAPTRVIVRLKGAASVEEADVRGGSAAREALAGEVARVLSSIRAGGKDVRGDAGNIQADSETTRAIAEGVGADLGNTPAAAGAIRALPTLGLAIIEGVGKDSATFNALATHPDVEWVEASLPRRFRDAAAEPFFRAQWGLENTADPRVKAELQVHGRLPLVMVPGADIGAREAWQRGEGSPRVVVAVLDSGVDTTHIDLLRNMWVNEGEIPGNGVDDDGNGYIDDVNGWNAFAGTGDVSDPLGHGTHVAGIVAAAANGRGVAGVAPRVRIMAVSVLNPESEWEDDAAIITGIEYILDQAARGVNVRAVNVSLGGPGKSRSLQFAFAALARRGILAVLAAGNESASNDLFVSDYPGGYPLPNLITVGASDPSDTPAAYSDFGEYSVDLFAPGTAIVSSIPAAAIDEYAWTRGNFSWAAYSGTSMAAPMVTGAVAFACGLHPEAGWRRIKDLVLGTATRIDAFGGFSRRGTRLDLAAMATAPIPTAPVLYRLSKVLPLPGDLVTIHGHNLGSRAGSVKLDGTALEVSSWLPTAVTARLPQSTATRGPKHTLTVSTVEGPSATMPVYLADVGPTSGVSVGIDGGYSTIAPHEKKMAVTGDSVHGVIQCGPRPEPGFEQTNMPLAWGRLNLRTHRLDYLGELPAGFENWKWSAVAALGDFVYCIGGVTEGKVWRYHVPSGAWDDSIPQPVAGFLRAPAMASDGEHLYLAGGAVGENSSARELNTTVFRFDADTASWTAVGEWAGARLYAAALVSGTKLLLAGGTLPLTVPQYPTAKCDVLDLSTGQWITSEMPVGVASGELARVGDAVHFFAPREAAGGTTPFVFSTPWPPKDGGKWRMHPTRFDFLDLDRSASWAFRYQGDIHMAGGDATGCLALECPERLRIFSLGLD